MKAEKASSALKAGKSKQATKLFVPLRCLALHLRSRRRFLHVFQPTAIRSEPILLAPSHFAGPFLLRSLWISLGQIISIHRAQFRRNDVHPLKVSLSNLVLLCFMQRAGPMFSSSGIALHQF